MAFEPFQFHAALPLLTEALIDRVPSRDWSKYDAGAAPSLHLAMVYYLLQRLAHRLGSQARSRLVNDMAFAQPSAQQAGHPVHP
jgi:hypothetical protein